MSAPGDLHAVEDDEKTVVVHPHCARRRFFLDRTNPFRLWPISVIAGRFLL
jgi:hypothetical protein